MLTVLYVNYACCTVRQLCLLFCTSTMLAVLYVNYAYCSVRQLCLLYCTLTLFAVLYVNYACCTVRQLCLLLIASATYAILYINCYVGTDKVSLLCYPFYCSAIPSMDEVLKESQTPLPPPQQMREYVSLLVFFCDVFYVFCLVLNDKY